MPFDPEAVRAFEHARWERAAGGYGTSFALATRGFIDPLLDAAAVTAGTRLLDIACGPGPVASRALERGAVAAGLDFSAAMLAVAREACPGAAFHLGDAEALPFADTQFDSAVSNFGVHHVPRPAIALREAFRVLRPNGRFAFTIWADPRENVAWKLVLDAVRRFGDPSRSTAPPPGGGFSTAGHCADALRDAGFTDIRTDLRRRVWHHPGAESLIAALRTGTARMAAMLESQPAESLAAILSEIRAQAEPWRDASGIAVPIAAVIASGMKP